MLTAKCVELNSQSTDGKKQCGIAIIFGHER